MHYFGLCWMYDFWRKLHGGVFFPRVGFFPISMAMVICRKLSKSILLERMRSTKSPAIKLDHITKIFYVSTNSRQCIDLPVHQHTPAAAMWPVQTQPSCPYQTLPDRWCPFQELLVECIRVELQNSFMNRDKSHEMPQSAVPGCQVIWRWCNGKLSNNKKC